MTPPPLRPQASPEHSGTSAPVPGAATGRWPSWPLRLACGSWALLVGLAAGTGVDTRRTVLFHLAVWPPVLIMLVPLVWRRPRLPWRLMAYAVVCFLMASVLESFARYKALTVPEDLSLSDPLFLVGYVLLLGGVAMLISRHGRRAIRAGVADGLIVLIPAVVLLIEYVVLPGSDAADPWYQRLIVGIYPLLDVVLVAAVVWLMASPTLSHRHLGGLLSGAVAMLVLDFLLAADLLEPYSITQRALEDLYPLTYTLLAVGVAVGATTEPQGAGRAPVVHWGRVWLLALGALMGPLVVAVAAVGPNELPVGWVALAALVSVGLIVSRMIGLARTLQTVTEQLSEARRDLERQATHDPLTGLWNRAVLDEVLGLLEEPTARPAALLSIDLDRFKEVNDRFGHAAGDQVLEVAAERMRHAVRHGDRVVRMGGDEFLVVLPNVASSEVETLAHRLVDSIEQPVSWMAEPLHVSASVGVAILPAGALPVGADELVARADAAMYAAKRTGSGGIEVTSTGGTGERLGEPTGPRRDGSPATTLRHHDHVDADRTGDRPGHPGR
jgi:diguanylate cyclase (GGDEF)-like protein